MAKNSVVFQGVSFIAVLLMTLSTVSAFAGMGGSNNSVMGNPTQSYGTDIGIMQHLIEIDQFSQEGFIKAAETIVFFNSGTENYTGPMYTYLPDGASNVVLASLEMAMGGKITEIDGFLVNEHVAGWNGTVMAGQITMYRMEYLVPAESAEITFAKKFKYPTLVNYQYRPSPGMPALVVKVTASDDVETRITSGSGGNLVADSVEDREGSRTYNWVQPQFEEFSITMSTPRTGGSDITMYLLIALVVLGVISYPVLRGKSPALRNLGEKLGRLMPEKQDDELYGQQDENDEYADEDEYSDEEYVDGAEYKDEIVEEEVEEIDEDDTVSAADDNRDFNLEQLKSAKKSILNVLLELDNDYSQGNVSEEEYLSIRSDYKHKAMEIMGQIDDLEKQDD